MVYAALIPIIGGVGLASLKELSFTWTALIAASLANQAAAFKNVVSKVCTWYVCVQYVSTFAVTRLRLGDFQLLRFDSSDPLTSPTLES